MTDNHAHQMFMDDIEGVDCAYGIPVRSPIARGSIQKIELPELPPGYWSVQAAEIPGSPLLGYSESDMPFLAETQVRYRGEPLLLLAGPDRETLAELARDVKIRYREAQAVTSLSMVDPEKLKPELHIYQGDPRKAFRDSYQIVEGAYSIGPQSPLGLIPQGALAFMEDRTLTVWAAVLDPFFLRDQIAALLAISPRRVRVKVPRVSPPREEQALTALLAAGHAALLSHAGGRAVNLCSDPGGETCFFAQENRCHVRQSTALDREGKPLGVRLEIVLDGGAYRTSARQVLREAILVVVGTYKCANIEVVGKLAQTNTSPGGLSVLAGQAAVAFAGELHQARLAEISQLDPYVWKRDQLKTKKTAVKVLEQAVTAADYRRKHAAFAASNTRRKTYLSAPHPLRGVGLSLCVQTEAGQQGCGLPGDPDSPRVCAIKVSLEKNKQLHVYSSIVEMGQQRERIFAGTASSILDLGPESILIEPVDTATVPDSGFTSMSRTFEINRLLEKCCRVIQKQSSGRSLPLEVRRSFRFTPVPAPRKAGNAQIPRAAGAWAGTVVEVEVDAETLQPSCRQIVMVVEAGRLLDLDYARTQLEAGILSALSRVSWGGRTGTQGMSPEKVRFFPGPTETPAITVSFLKNPARDHEVRAFDALPDLGIAAAYTAAVSQATGLYIDEIPLTPEVIQRCLLAAEK
jgi:CO/xanthine dehydrogenase Mo-binding subunit